MSRGEGFEGGKARWFVKRGSGRYFMKLVLHWDKTEGRKQKNLLARVILQGLESSGWDELEVNRATKEDFPPHSTGHHAGLVCERWPCFPLSLHSAFLWLSWSSNEVHRDCMAANE